MRLARVLVESVLCVVLRELLLGQCRTDSPELAL